MTESVLHFHDAKFFKCDTSNKKSHRPSSRVNHTKCFAQSVNLLHFCNYPIDWSIRLSVYFFRRSCQFKLFCWKRQKNCATKCVTEWTECATEALNSSMDDQSVNFHRFAKHKHIASELLFFCCNVRASFEFSMDISKQTPRWRSFSFVRN